MLRSRNSSHRRIMFGTPITTVYRNRPAELLASRIQHVVHQGLIRPGQRRESAATPAAELLKFKMLHLTNLLYFNYSFLTLNTLCPTVSSSGQPKRPAHSAPAPVPGTVSLSRHRAFRSPNRPAARQRRSPRLSILPHCHLWDASATQTHTSKTPKFLQEFYNP